MLTDRCCLLGCSVLGCCVLKPRPHKAAFGGCQPLVPQQHRMRQTQLHCTRTSDPTEPNSSRRVLGRRLALQVMLITKLYQELQQRLI